MSLKKRKETPKQRYMAFKNRMKELENKELRMLPNLVNPQINKAIEFKRSSKYNESIKIYETLYKEFGELIGPGALAGWAKVLACSGRFEEAIHKYKLAIDSSKYTKNKAYELQYKSQLNELKPKKGMNFESFLKRISGNVDFEIPLEIKYIPEQEKFEDIFEDEFDFSSKEIIKAEPNIKLIEDIRNKLIKNALNESILKGLNDNNLKISKWIFTFDKKIWVPKEFRIIKNENLQEISLGLNNILIVTMENDNEEIKELKYAVKNQDIEVWNNAEVNFAEINFHGNEFNVINNTGAINKNEIKFTGRMINCLDTNTNERHFSLEYFDETGNIYLMNNQTNSIQNYDTTILHKITFLGYCLNNYAHNPDFYLKTIFLLIVSEESLIYNNLLSILIIKHLKKKNIINTNEEKELIDYWEINKYYNHTHSQFFLLIPNLKNIIKKEFDHHNLREDIFQNLYQLAENDRLLTSIYNSYSK